MLRPKFEVSSKYWRETANHGSEHLTCNASTEGHELEKETYRSARDVRAGPLDEACGRFAWGGAEVDYSECDPILVAVFGRREILNTVLIFGIRNDHRGGCHDRSASNGVEDGTEFHAFG